MFGGQHAAANRLVGAFDFGHVEQAGGIANQERAWHLAIGQGLIAAGDNRARAGRQDTAALQ